MKNLLSVRCLMIDFSKALDRVSHPILLSRLSELELLDRAVNWIISYLTWHTKDVRCNGSITLPASINTSIVQGSGIGPMLNAFMERDIDTLSVKIESLSTLLRLKKLYLSDPTQGCTLLLSPSLRFNRFRLLNY